MRSHLGVHFVSNLQLRALSSSSLLILLSPYTSIHNRYNGYVPPPTPFPNALFFPFPISPSTLFLIHFFFCPALFASLSRPTFNSSLNLYTNHPTTILLPLGQFINYLLFDLADNSYRPQVCFNSVFFFFFFLFPYNVAQIRASAI